MITTINFSFSCQTTSLFHYAYSLSHNVTWLYSRKKPTDGFTLPVQVFPDCFAQAKHNHSFFHQNVAALCCTFALKHHQAKDIIAACHDCQCHNFVTGSPGINWCGLQNLQIWQTDFIHCPEFGCLKYIHSSTDTFSGALFASCHTGETAKDACHHFLAAFVTLGIPQQIKTDNGPAYTSQ